MYQHLRLHKEKPSIDAVASVRASHFSERTSVWYALLKIITYAQDAKEKYKYSQYSASNDEDIQDPKSRVRSHVLIF